jgi:hypothetical protein
VVGCGPRIWPPSGRCLVWFRKKKGRERGRPASLGRKRLSVAVAGTASSSSPGGGEGGTRRRRDGRERGGGS